jgi:hypothetical protein
LCAESQSRRVGPLLPASPPAAARPRDNSPHKNRTFNRSLRSRAFHQTIDRDLSIKTCHPRAGQARCGSVLGLLPPTPPTRRAKTQSCRDGSKQERGRSSVRRPTGGRGRDHRREPEAVACAGLSCLALVASLRNRSRAVSGAEVNSARDASSRTRAGARAGEPVRSAPGAAQPEGL